MTKYKVAIATWYNYKNYGTALQAGAMTNCISKLGGDAFMLAYEPKGTLINTTPLTFASFIKRCMKRLFGRRTSLYLSAERDELFDFYLKERVNETAECRTFPELRSMSEGFDAILCGSDQIWSPLCFDSKYFLDFVENTNKMIAYAPSIGSTEIANPVIAEKMTSLISRFTHLSVREKQGADLIKQLTGKDAEVVLDPTLLMSASEWDEYIKEKEATKINKDYIVCYFLGDARKYMSYVRLISKKLNAPFFVIPVTTEQKKSKECVPFEVGPCEFVSLIRNAKYVCTDSFHGMAFSINYNIPFSVFKRFKDNDPRNQNSRIFSLLDQLDLQSRIVDYRSKPIVSFDCDFSKSNMALSILRKSSLAFLSNSLQAATSKNEKKSTLPYKITELCCGCGACATICPKNAITIQKNNEGFEHYSIDDAKCVQCEKCKTACPTIDIIAPDLKTTKALHALKSNSESTLNRSSSGGIGYELASFLLDEGYAVCGCTYNSSTCSAEHIWIMPNEKEKLYLLQGSKYIQSRTVDAFKKLPDIIREHPIAFFGTPCQASAIDKLLSKNRLRDKAIVVDLICHGVPSQHLFTKYLSDINKKYKTGLNPSVSFRSKKYGWRSLTMEINGNCHSYKNNERKDDFYAFFRRSLCYMEICSDCPYRERSGADLRIGDYWGPRFANDSTGVSMALSLTDRCDFALDSLKENKILQSYDGSIKDYWTIQYPYNHQRPLVREALIEDLKSQETSIKDLRKKYCKFYDQSEKINDILKFIKRILRK